MPLSALAQPTPPSNPLRIGNTVVGGTATRVLYVDSSGKLANDGDFTWNDSANILQIVGSVDGTFSQFANGYIGVFDGSAQGPQIVIPDFYASGTSGLYYYNGSGNAIATYNSNTSGWAFGPNYTSTSSANTFEQSTVFNEAGAAVNTRIESDTNANMLYVNGASNGVIIGGSSVLGSSALTVNGDMYIAAGSNNKINFDRTNTTSYGRLLYLTAGVEKWGLGQRGDTGGNDFTITGNDTHSYPRVLTIVPGATYSTYWYGTSTSDADIWYNSSGAAVFNEQGNAQDFRVEGDTKTHLLYIGGAVGDVVGINADSSAITAGGGSVLTVKSDANGSFTNVFGALAPSTTAGGRACFNVGVTNSANNLNSFCFKYAGSGSTNNSFDVFFSFASTPAFQVSAANKAGINIGAGPATSYLDVQGTTEQLRLLYDGSNYLSTTVSSAGAVTWDAVGASAGFTFSDSVTIADTKNIIINTSTGTKIGTGTTQKIGFWNATPVAQQAGTGETVGFTAGAGTNVTDASTFTGNVGSTAYRISDIVKALKNIGALAQ